MDTTTRACMIQNGRLLVALIADILSQEFLEIIKDSPEQRKDSANATLLVVLVASWHHILHQFHGTGWGISFGPRYAPSTAHLKFPVPTAEKRRIGSIMILLPRFWDLLFPGKGNYQLTLIWDLLPFQFGNSLPVQFVFASSLGILLIMWYSLFHWFLRRISV
ncbi:hypothetical protein SLEP1_g44902 [Rubroshorea leprosula]|uniref:Uncharacterized protein n=1 Tax=Rubroshorea leprosula TaxID=152421 RepID=A0AAV5LI55_9ROSI|nr:hypothetical protein SLEP1_g44902 [Rubroshorea leprosula]